MRLSRQEAFLRLDQVHAASSFPEMLDTFDALAVEFGVLGFALLLPQGQFGDRPEEMLSQSSTRHYASPGFLAAIPATHCLVIAPDGPAWEPTPGNANVLPIRRSGEHMANAGGIVVPLQSLASEAFEVSFVTQDLDADADNLLWLMILADALDTGRRRLGEQGAYVPSGLSSREQEILRWFAEGKSAEDVAAIMAIAPATVMFHYRNVALRFGTLNRTHTVVEAIRRGLLRLPELAADFRPEANPAAGGPRARRGAYRRGLA
ncbi:MAG TPA: helix-turn-helix domain-containing protein [Devosia sp.]|nr:helix-turn-helix domain-containing protein [Devosia sp.]